MSEHPATAQYTEEQQTSELEDCTLAREALQTGEYAAAEELLITLSKQGNLTAKVDLALLHLRELVEAPVFDFAVTLLQEASISGMPMASAQLAAAYEDGKGTPQNTSLAHKYYLIAANQGDPDGMFNAGRCYLFGIGTEQSTENAMNWIGHAAHLDHILACYWMGGIYLNAQYVVPDPAMASNFYERGATLGNGYCQNKLGIMYRDGVGRAANWEQALALFLLSTDSGNEWGQFLLGQMYLTGTHVNQDLDRARQLFTLSAEQGLAEAQFELGAIYGKGLGVAADRRRSIELYKLAADQDDANANFNLGVIYINGDGVDRDIEIGVRYVSKAARLGMDEASEILKTLKQ